MVGESRTPTELAELEEWLTTDPAEMAERERAHRLDAIARMGGGLVHPTPPPQGGEQA